jgi:hypothetical protein
MLKPKNLCGKGRAFMEGFYQPVLTEATNCPSFRRSWQILVNGTLGDSLLISSLRAMAFVASASVASACHCVPWRLLHLAMIHCVAMAFVASAFVASACHCVPWRLLHLHSSMVNWVAMAFFASACVNDSLSQDTDRKKYRPPYPRQPQLRICLFVCLIQDLHETRWLEGSP